VTSTPSMTPEMWAKFEHHVVAGRTLARLPTWKADCIVMSTFPFREIDNAVMGILDQPTPNWDITGLHARIDVTWFKYEVLGSEALSWPVNYPAGDLLYFVNGRWLSLDQIVNLEAVS